MDHGCKVRAKVLEIVTGPSNYDCLIEITREKLNQQEADTYDEKLTEANDARKEAYSLTNSEPDRAAFLFKRCMELLGEFDQLCRGNNIPTWRHISHPINKLTMILERQKKYKECLGEIEKYQQIKDEVGLTKSDAESISKRKARILKKLS
jgi:hypothetical protein